MLRNAMRLRPFFARRMVTMFMCIIASSAVLAQHTDHSINVHFAASGQIPLFKTTDNPQNFFSSPVIFQLQYQAATDYIHSVAVTVEHMSEERAYSSLWSNVPSPGSSPYNADIRERLTMTTLGLEGMRTVYSDGRFRIGAGLGLAFGLGRAHASVTQLTTKQTREFTSCDLWSGLEVALILRAKYRIYKREKFELGITATMRYWGFPSIGPLSQCSSEYNGPAFRSLHQIGYLFGVTAGF